MFTFWWKPHHYRFTCHVSHFHSHFHTLCYVSHLSRVMYWPHLPQATKITHYNIWVRIYILYFEKKTDFHMKRCFLILCCLRCMEPWDPEMQFHCQCVTWHWTFCIQLKCLRICVVVEILQQKIQILNFEMHGTLRCRSIVTVCHLTLDILHPLRMPLWPKNKSIQTLVFATENCKCCNQKFISPCFEAHQRSGSRKCSGFPLWHKVQSILKSIFWSLQLLSIS